MKNILLHYGSPFENATLELLSGGLINQTWKVEASGESFILQRINHHVFSDPQRIADNIRLLADHLNSSNSNYQLIAPIKTIKGAELVREADGYFRLTPFVKNSKTIHVVETSAQAYEAAFQFGQFTQAFSKFNASQLQTTIPDFHNLKFRYKQFLDSLQNGNTQRIQSCAKEIKEIERYHFLVDQYISIIHNPAFKLRVTHHDTKISNVLFDGSDKGICVIDLDTVMPGYFFSDVGDMMRTYLAPANEEEKDFTKIEVRPDYYHAIVQGYSDAMKDELSKEENTAFFFAGQFLIYMQALRFLTDYFNDDCYYGARYEHHNLTRAQNQLQLLDQFGSLKIR
ncbi:MAG: phosphotransferase enzyme family protein [Cyclobacteriaceae bacterium]|jgi:thiamine kinase-like enzyme|nr:aminoglycoside phosphotransferase family protein [Flammeovirgaceae bacterium]